MRTSKIWVFTAGLIILSLTGYAQIPRQVKVIIDQANIRSRPELEAEILDIAAKGALFEVIEKAGSWYAIKIGEDQSGKPIYGYIHESMVEPSGAVEPKAQAVAGPEPAPPPPPPPQEVNPAQAAAKPREKLISGGYIKYGFGDHWLGSIGVDFGIGRYFGLGLEFQPYYDQSPEIDLSLYQMDIFVNAKLGFKLWFLTFYGGGGIGPDFSFVTTDIGGQSFNQFETMLAYHGILGVALNIGRIAITFEYQPIMVSDPDLDPDTWGQFFFVGLRF